MANYTGTTGADNNSTVVGGNYTGADTLSGLAGNDTLWGDGINSTVGGADSINGGADNDILFGGLGLDTLKGDSGNDTLYAGSLTGTALNGTNHIYDNVVDRLIGDAGNDVFLVYGNDSVSDSVTGTAATDNADRIILLDTTGITTPYVIATNVENFQVGFGTASEALANNNTFNLNITANDSSSNQVYATGGANLVLLGAGNDTVWGANGNDTLSGEAGNDSLLGGGDNDSLSGGAGNDVLLGGAGNDTLYGGSISGTTYTTDSAADTLTGGAGDDVYVLQGSDSLDFNNINEVAAEGTDRVVLLSTNASGFTLRSEVENFQAGLGTASLTLANATTFAINVTGNASKNEIWGTSVANRLDGGANDDTLYGANGNDTLVGGTGNDVLDGGAGTDSMDGGAGSDTYYVDVTTDVVTDTGLSTDGRDAIITTVALTSLHTSVENLELGGSVVSGVGNASDNVIKGNSVANNITGLAGNDTIDGGAGADTMDGGVGADVYYSDSAADVINDTGTLTTERDLLYSSVSVDSAAGLAASLEDLTLVDVATALTAKGNSKANILTGNSFNNTLIGAEGGDTLSGGLGNDTLDGGAGIDLMQGGGGADVYVVDSAADVVDESTGDAAIDRIVLTDTSGTAYTMAVGVENLQVGAGAASVALANQSLFNLDITGNGSANIIHATGGDNYVYAKAGDDTVYAANGDDFVSGDEGNDVLDGGEGNNVLMGGTGTDSLIGGSGTDLLYGDSVVGFSYVGDGQVDTLVGGDGNDDYYLTSVGDVIVENANALNSNADRVLWVGEQAADYTLVANVEQAQVMTTAAVNLTGNVLANVLTGGSGANRLSGGLGNDTLLGGGGNDTLNGDAGVDMMDGGAGSDTYYYNEASDVIQDTGAGVGDIDTVITTLNDTTLVNSVENLIMAEGSGAFTAFGNNSANVIVGNANSNSIDGQGGADSLVGGGGADYLYGGTYDYDNGLYVPDTDADTLVGGDGNDAYYVSTTDDVVVEDSVAGSGQDTIYLVDTLTGGVPTGVDYQMAANVEKLYVNHEYDNPDTQAYNFALNVLGNSTNNIISVTAGANKVNGGDGNDSINGWGGNDTLYGGNGQDILIGGLGDDYIDGEDGGDTILGGQGENVLLGGMGADSMVGGSGYDLLYGDGLSGFSFVNDGQVDTLVGGDGNDEYYLTSVGDAIVESANALNSNADKVLWVGTVAADYVLDANVEQAQVMTTAAVNLTGNGLANVLTGGSGANSLSGGAGDDTLMGGGGNDTLDGGSGVDQMDGSMGSDTYYYNEASDVILDTGTGVGDIDTVITTLDSTTLVNSAENLVLAQASAASVAFGNNSANVIVGNANSNSIDGFGGADSLVGGGGDDYLYGGTYDYDNGLYLLDTDADTLVGGDGNDTYFVMSSQDVVVETGLVGSTADTILLVDTVTGGVPTGVEYQLAANVEKLYIFSDLPSDDPNQFGFDLKVRGNDSNNTISANAGVNVLYGEGGNDSLNGYAGNDTLYGGAGNDSLQGGSGSDYMDGGTGSDTYYFSETGDVVHDSGTAGDGIDKVISRYDYTLADDIENLSLGSNAVRGEGNRFDNYITGSSMANVLIGGEGNDTLNGGALQDTMDGGAGSDVYFVDLQGDVVTDSGLASDGRDKVIATVVNYVLNDLTIEDLELSGVTGNRSGTGNANGNRITGMLLANNLLNGMGGDDTLRGGLGDDTLDGGAGVDNMDGGGGSDVYLVDGADSTVVDSGDVTDGFDEVRASVNYVLDASVEGLVLTGTAVQGTGADNDNQLVGNSLDNRLEGLGGNDTLDGGVGGDTLVGGNGSDTYVVDSYADVVEETGTQAGDRDTLIISVEDASMADTMEDMVMMGAAYWGTGNNNNNVITGTDQANWIAGGYGADYLRGLGGNDELYAGAYDWGTFVHVRDTLVGNEDPIDTLEGGAGADTYYIDGDKTVIIETEPYVLGENDSVIWDPVASDNGKTYTLADNVENFGVGGSMSVNPDAAGINASINVIGNAGNNQLRGTSGANRMEGGLGNDYIQSFDGADTLLGGFGDDTLDGGAMVDSMDGGAGADVYFVNDVQDVVRDSGSRTEGEDVVRSTSATYTLDASIEHLRLLDGVSVVTGIGNAGNNMLWGNRTANNLQGLGGDDILRGGNGNDTLQGGDGNDILMGDDLAIGADSMLGGEGSDIYYVNSLSDVVSDTGTFELDADRIITYVQLTGDLQGDIEELQLEEVSTLLTGAGNSLDNVIWGNGQNNTLYGRAGMDILYGGVGDDTLDGGAGNGYLFGEAGSDRLVGGNDADVLDGGAGVDLLEGGLGDDTYYVDSVNDVVLESAGQGHDKVVWLIDGAIGQVMNLAANVEDAQMVASSSGLFNRLQGNALNNQITGSSEDDEMSGGAGNDTLTGGLGNDTYRYAMGDGADVIVDQQDITLINPEYSGENSLVLTDLAWDRLWFSRIQNTGDLLIQVMGSGGNNITVKDWFDTSVSSNPNEVPVVNLPLGEITALGGVGHRLPANVVDGLVNRMAEFGSSPAPGQTVLTTAQANVLATFWQTPS